MEVLFAVLLVFGCPVYLITGLIKPKLVKANNRGRVFVNTLALGFVNFVGVGIFVPKQHTEVSQVAPRVEAVEPSPITTKPQRSKITVFNNTEIKEKKLTYQGKELPLASCGDPNNGEEIWYPVYASKQTTLVEAKKKYCTDSISVTRKDDNGEQVIQVASFSDETRARDFSSLIHGEVGSEYSLAKEDEDRNDKLPEVQSESVEVENQYPLTMELIETAVKQHFSETGEYGILSKWELYNKHDTNKELIEKACNGIRNGWGFGSTFAEDISGIKFQPFNDDDRDIAYLNLIFNAAGQSNECN